MLYIKARSAADKRLTTEIEWHIGDPMPEIAGRVVSFQADGDELAYLLGAIRLGSRPRMVEKYVYVTPSSAPPPDPIDLFGGGGKR